MNLREAREATGHKTGLGKPSKMPGYSTSLPAAACKVGAKLARVKGSVCASCYAKKGNYLYESVQGGLQRRLEALVNSRWAEGMIKLVGHYTNENDPYFRIHDSGDFQSVKHIEQWVAVARALPWVNFWAPSREARMVAQARRTVTDWPANLVIRISAPMVGRASKISGPTSSVDAGVGHRCPAPTQGNKCGPCRACWDLTVANVDYCKH